MGLNDGLIGATRAQRNDYPSREENMRACVASAPRPPASLVDLHHQLNELVCRGKNEEAALDRILTTLQNTLRGPIPCDPKKDSEVPHFPLCELPDILIGQVNQRARVLDEIAIMLGVK